MPEKRKRTAISNQIKRSIIEYHEREKCSHQSVTNYVNEVYKIKIKRNTVTGIISD